MVKVLNVNEGHNRELLDACKSLREYSIFVSKVRKYMEEELISSDSEERKEIIRKAVTKAINECINEGILKDFFLQYRKEAIEVSILEYSAERHIQAIADENYESGLEKGIEKGIEIKLIKLVCKKIVKGKSPDIIAEELDEDSDHIQEIYDTALKFAPDYDSEKIYDALPKKALVKE